MKISKPILFLVVLVISQKIFGAPQLNNNIKVIEINYERGENFVLNQQDEEKDFQILTPRNLTVSYYLIRSGIKVAPSSGSKGSLTFFGPLPESNPTCIGENFYDNSFSVGSNFLSAQEKKKIFDTCTKFKVEETQKGKLEFEPTQRNCNLERIDDSTAIISTGDCFFKAIPGQVLKLQILTNPKCNDRAFLSQNKLFPTEIQAQWTAFSYPEKDIGSIFTPEGEPIWNLNLFINLNSGKELLKITGTDDGKNPTIYRPEIFVFPDFMLSNFSISHSTRSSFADIGFLVSTYGGKDFCDSSLCSAYGNYDSPFVPYFILYEIDKKTGRKYEVKSFFMGDRLPGKWNGTLFQRLNFKDYQFEIGKKYSIELSFSDPASSYLELKRSYMSVLGLGSTSLGSIGGSGIHTFSGFGEIPSIRSEVGTLSGISSNGGFFDPIASIPQGQIPRIIESFYDPTFPPEYTIVCNKNMTTCKNANTKDQEKLSITFEVKGIDPSNKLDFGGSVEVQRSGKFLPEYKTIFDLNKMPKLNCGGAF